MAPPDPPGLGETNKILPLTLSQETIPLFAKKDNLFEKQIYPPSFPHPFENELWKVLEGPFLSTKSESCRNKSQKHSSLKNITVVLLTTSPISFFLKGKAHCPDKVRQRFLKITTAQELCHLPESGWTCQQSITTATRKAFPQTCSSLTPRTDFFAADEKRCKTSNELNHNATTSLFNFVCISKYCCD